MAFNIRKQTYILLKFEVITRSLHHVKDLRPQENDFFKANLGNLRISNNIILVYVIVCMRHYSRP